MNTNVHNISGSDYTNLLLRRGDNLTKRLSSALARSKTGLEAAPKELSYENAITYLRGDGVQRQLQRLEEILPNKANESMREVLNAASQALVEIRDNENLSAEGIFGLEALILLAGRPVLKTIDADICLKDPVASEWHDKLYLAQRPPSYLSQRIAAVGRIDLDGSQIGTGFVVGKDLILTNRHVVQCCAEFQNKTNTWKLQGVVTIDFADSPSNFNEELRFRVLEIVASGPNFISQLDTGWTKADIALIKTELVNSDGTPLPEPIPLDSSETSLGGLDDLLVIGYPARPSSLPRTVHGDIDDAVVARLGELFGVYGVRVVAPGVPQWNNAKSNGWAFPHDATTLEGSSGSCVLSFDGYGVGLHFGGTWRHTNYAHGLARVRNTSNIFASAKMSWVDR